MSTTMTSIICLQLVFFLMGIDASKENREFIGNHPDIISKLPGQPEGIKFNQYSGYVTVNTTNGRELFYYLTESSEDPDSKPLVLWLNGGPGSSSIGNGAMQEIGPFLVISNTMTLTKNEHAWNKVANILFLESPVGVGYSYSNTSADYDYAGWNGDSRTAADGYNFLVNWLERFPEYKLRDFYITGESYAGHYATQLAHTILEQNRLKNSVIINLRGMALGNAAFLFDEYFLFQERNKYYWWCGIITEETLEMLESSCMNNSHIGDNPECLVIRLPANVDMYNVNRPKCNYTDARYHVNACIERYVTPYMNNPEVQKAMHARPVPWSAIVYLRNQSYNIHEFDETIIDSLKQLLTSGLKVWLYSGDADQVIPFTYTEGIIQRLGTPIRNTSRLWYYNGEPSGIVTEYEGLTFVTVMGAGHMVPSDRPERALKLFSSFLDGSALLS